jgi:ATP-dependent helicase Lhr and Lhr-like helicase
LYGLAETRVIASNGGVHLFPWRGSGACHVFAAALRKEQVKAQAHDLAISTSDASLDQIAAALHRIRCYGPTDLDDLFLWSEGVTKAKYDNLIPRTLLHRLWMRRSRQAITAVPAIAAELLESFAR